MYKNPAQSQSRNYKVYLTQGRFNGVYTWYYIKVETLKQPLFLKSLQYSKNEPTDVAEYGEILYSGWGPQPPDDIRKKVALAYS